MGNYLYMTPLTEVLCSLDSTASDQTVSFGISEVLPVRNLSVSLFLLKHGICHLDIMILEKWWLSEKCHFNDCVSAHACAHHIRRAGLYVWVLLFILRFLSVFGT